MTRKHDIIFLSTTHFTIQDSITAWTNYNICLFQTRQCWCLVLIFSTVVGGEWFAFVFSAEYVSILFMIPLFCVISLGSNLYFLFFLH